MKADELRTLQAPLKAQYRERPETAFVTLRAEGRVGENITCKIETGKARVEAGLHPATGGDGKQRMFGGHAARSARRLRGRHPARSRDRPKHSIARREDSSRGRSRFSRYAGRLQRRASRLQRRFD